MQLSVERTVHKKIDWEAVKKLARTDVLVGIPEGGAHDHNGLNAATVLYINSKGSDLAHIPSRPLIEPTIEFYKEKIQEKLAAASKPTLDGDTASAKRQLVATGIFAVQKIRAWFNDESLNHWPDNALSTIRKKTRKMGKKARESIMERAEAGESVRDQVKPMIDTGALRRAISYVVRAGCLLLLVHGLSIYAQQTQVTNANITNSTINGTPIGASTPSTLNVTTASVTELLDSQLTSGYTVGVGTNGQLVNRGIDEWVSFSGCSFANDGANLTCAVTVTLPTAMPDTSYFLNCSQTYNNSYWTVINQQPPTLGTTSFTYNEIASGSSSIYPSSSSYGLTVTCHVHHL